VLNGLQVAVRRGRINIAYRDASLTDLSSLVIAIDPGTNHQAWSATLQLRDRFGLTPYDAAHSNWRSAAGFRSRHSTPNWSGRRKPRTCRWSALSLKA
jgi:hypothetical protein